MKVVEIFNSIEGEGKRVGRPCTFIRLFGCNMRCTYCDSMYAVSEFNGREMSVDAVVTEVDALECPLVTLTGGEPLIHKDVDLLLTALLAKGYEINVETNGSIIPRVRDKNIFYTVDFKTYASGESQKMNRLAFVGLLDTDVIKCVVGSQEDMEQSLEYLKGVNKAGTPSVYLSPVYGKIEPVKLVDFIKDNKLWNWSVQVQLHKIIFDPNARGV